MTITVGENENTEESINVVGGNIAEHRDAHRNDENDTEFAEDSELETSDEDYVETRVVEATESVRRRRMCRRYFRRRSDDVGRGFSKARRRQMEESHTRRTEIF